MKVALTIAGVFVAVLIVGAIGLVGYVFLSNRTIDQTLAKNTDVSTDWLEVSAVPPLGGFRQVQELAIAVSNHRFDRNERLPQGQFRLPDGRVASPQIEGVDLAGNIVTFRHSGFTYSDRDLVIFRTDINLKNNGLSKIRIRSDSPFHAEEIFWRNRNPK